MKYRLLWKIFFFVRKKKKTSTKSDIVKSGKHSVFALIP